MTTETFNKAVDTLLDAYNNGTLEHGHCQHCAVGNLLDTGAWAADFMTCFPRGSNLLIQRNYGSNNRLRKLYKEKGFTRRELMKIEYAFEYSVSRFEGQPVDKTTYEFYAKYYKKKGQYIGLCAVIDVMSKMVNDSVQSPVESKQRLTKIANEKYGVLVEM